MKTKPNTRRTGTVRNRPMSPLRRTSGGTNMSSKSTFMHIKHSQHALIILQVQLCCHKVAARCFVGYLSVISFSKLQNIERSLLLSVTQATDLSLCTLTVLFCCLWRNVETACHKHFVVVSRRQQTPLLTTSTSGKFHNLPRSGGAVLITPIAGSSGDSTR